MLTKFKNLITINSENDLREYSNYLHDESKLSSQKIDFIFFPSTKEELSSFLKTLDQTKEEQYSITISGARTGLTGGAVPLEYFENKKNILISLEKLKLPIELLNTSEGTFLKVSAPTSLLEVNEYLANNSSDFFFPVDPTERSASFGGMIATNAGGARSYKYGSMRSWVNGISVVLANGDILGIKRGEKISALSPLKNLNLDTIKKPSIKNAIGPNVSPDGDLIDLFIGSEGIFGIVTEAEIRLLSKPEEVVGFLQFFNHESLALKFVNNLRDTAGDKLISIEYFDTTSIHYALRSKKSFGDKIIEIINKGDSFAVFFELQTDLVEGGLDAFFTSYMELGEELGINLESCIIADDITKLEDVKAFRHAIPEQINAEIFNRKKSHPTLRKVATDMAVPNEKLEEVVSLYRSKFGDVDLEFAIFGHIGNNHFHVNVLPKDEEDLKRALNQYLDIAKSVVELGGVVSAEHGIGRIKRSFLKVQFTETDFNTLKTIKNALDPDGILNTGVLI